MITLKLKGKEYTLAEAQELYEELDKIFGRDRNEYWPMWPTPPMLPEPHPYFPTTPSTPWFTIRTMETNSAGRPSDITLGLPVSAE